MANKTYKQKKQEEEYNKWRRQQKKSLHDSEDLFGLKHNQTRHVNKYCSKCGHHWAWYSSDSGETWQCSEHRRS